MKALAFLAAATLASTLAWADDKDSAARGSSPERNPPPPAWSCLPESALKRTSTKPFSSEVFGSTHHGNVPLPDCSSTLGLLGAASSVRTFHCGAPRPVTPCCHPAGSPPGFS